jgi:hypothetical protein
MMFEHNRGGFALYGFTVQNTYSLQVGIYSTKNMHMGWDKKVMTITFP